MVRYLALGKTGNRETNFTEQRMLSMRIFLSSLGVTATCFDYTNVYELNDGFGRPDILSSMEQVRQRYRP
jgi:hypothetical protein